MYHHLKIAESKLEPSGKDGEHIPIRQGGMAVPYKKIGFTVSYTGDVNKLISRIVYNAKRYGKFIPNKFRYIVRPSEYTFSDSYNDVIWSVNTEKTKRVRYFNFKAEIQCLP